MSNATRSAPLVLKDKKQRLLRYTNDALMKLEDATGMTALEHMQRVKVGSVRSLAALVWAGIIHAEPKHTIETVGRLIDMTDLKGVADAIAFATAEAYGQDEDDGETADAETEGEEGKAEP